MLEGSDKKKSDTTVMLVWRGINLTMAVFFFLAAYVNLNDDDWYLWTPIYTLPGLLCLPLVIKPELAENKFWSSTMVIHFTLCCAYALYQIVLLLEAVGSRVENHLQHEEGREMGGLLILITWLGVSRFTDIGRPGKSVSSKGYMSALLLMMVTLTILPLFIWPGKSVSSKGYMSALLLMMVTLTILPLFIWPGKSVSSKGYMSALLLMMVTLTILPLFIWSLCFISDWHTKLGHCTGMFRS